MSGHDRLAFMWLYSAMMVARGFANLIIPLYFVSVGIPVIDIGIAIGVFGGSLLVFEILWGVIFDRIGGGWLSLIAVGLITLTYFLIPLVKTPEGAVATEFVLGAATPIMLVVSRSRVIHERESKGWASGFGVLGSVYSLSQLAGSLLGSISVPSIGLVDCFYLVTAFPTVGYASYLFFSERSNTRQQPITRGVASQPEPSSRMDWRWLALLGVLAVPTFIGISFFTNIIQLVVTQTPAIGGTSFEAGVVVTSFWVSTAIFQPLLSSRAAKDARLWIAGGLLGSFLVFALMTQLYQVWELAVAAFMEGACFSIVSPLLLSLLMVGIPRRFVGRAMGFFGAAEDVGVITGPLVGSAVWVEFGLTSAYLTLGSVFLVVFVLFIVATRRVPLRLKR